jgi:DNA-binding beta-propeller fold protein YncE
MLQRDVQFASPTGIAIYYKDNSIFITDKTNHTIKKVNNESLQIFAGNGRSGSKDGEKVNARFCNPSGITIDQQSGSIYVSDKGSHTIRKITPDGVVSTLAGMAEKKGFTDGVGKAARFEYPKGIWYSDKHKAVFVCDYGNDRLRIVNVSDGTVKTVQYEIKGPHGVMELDDGTILVTSYSGNKIIKIAYKNGKFEGSVLAGSGKEGAEDGTLVQCSFNHPYGIAMDTSTNTCYVSDYRGHTIRTLTLT